MSLGRVGGIAEHLPFNCFGLAYNSHMRSPLNPARLIPTASLNRVRIVDLPGVALDPEVRGRLAYDLLSTQALAAHLRRLGDDLGLGDVEHLPDAALPMLHDRCFESGEPAVRSAAETVAAQFGRALGFLLLTLKRGDQPNRAAREDWDDSYWDHWHSIRRVILGGGLVSGQLGQHLLPYTRALLTQYGADCTVEVADYPALLPLIGAARALQVSNGTALVCDYGQSRVKRACANYEDGQLLALRTLPSLTMDWSTFDHETVDTHERALWLAGSLSQSLQTTLDELRRSGQQMAPALGISIASYIADGQPLARQGGAYSEMHILEQPLDRWLAGHLSEHTPEPVEMTLLHDGTAAAQVYGAVADGAVIMLGTALGIGFPHGAAMLRPLAPDFAVTPL